VIVKIYSRPNCTYCTRAKDFFHKKGIQYEELRVGDHITTTAYNELTGMKTVPAIFIDDSLIGGYNDLVEYAMEHPGVFNNG
jgi:glutaredoxin